MNAQDLFNSAQMTSLRDRLSAGTYFDLDSYKYIKNCYSNSPVQYDPPNLPIFRDVFHKATAEAGGNIPFHDQCFRVAKRQAADLLDEA